MKKTWKSCLAVAALLFAAGTSQAQDKSTVAVVSVSSYDNLLASIATIGETAGKPGLDRVIGAFIDLGTGGKGLAGVDKTKPWGMQVVMTENGPGGVAFIPVTDVKQLLAAVAAQAGEAEDVGDGIFALSDAPQPTFIKQQGNWAFIAQSKEQLANVPADPAQLLDGLNDDYAVAVRAYVQNIPEPMRQMAVEQMRGGFDAAMQQREGESKEDYELRKSAAEQSLKQLERVVNETDTITFGWAVDNTSKQTYVDVAMTAVPGTMLAKRLANKATASNFAGFLMDGAAFALHVNAASEATEADKAQVESQMKALRDRVMVEMDKDTSIPADSKATLKEAIGEIFDVLTETLKSGKADGGAVVLGNPLLTAAAGGHVADGKAIEAALKKIGKVAAEDPEAPKINWDAETYKGYNFHHLTVPAPDDDARRLMGDNIQVAAAASNDGVYVAAGADAVGTVKKLIDASAAAAGKESPPMQMIVSLGEVMKIASQAQPNDQNVQMMAAMLAQMKGSDSVRIVGDTIENGVNYRLSVDEGVIKLIGQAAAMAGGAGQGGAPPQFGPGGF